MCYNPSKTNSMDITIYQKIDQKLFDLEKKMRTSAHLEATNGREEKEKFLSGKVRNPQLKYISPLYNTQEFERILSRFKLPDDEIGLLIQEKITELKIQNKIIENLGDEEFVKEKWKKKYGKPSKILINKAKKLLENSSDTRKEKKKYSASEVTSQIKNHLKNIGINDWGVIERKKHTVSVNRKNKKVKISSFKKYSKKEIKRLKAHEIQVHVFRSENGYQQPLRIFVSGLPGYLSTEEGIAAYLEEKNNVATDKSQKRFALRVIAVNAVSNGADFRECFDMISKYEPDVERCWETTYRVFRGGGYLKDHVYLEGYYKIKEFINNGGDLEDLYVGKIGLEHVELCKQLVKDGILKPPKYLPYKNPTI